MGPSLSPLARGEGCERRAPSPRLRGGGRGEGRTPIMHRASPLTSHWVPLDQLAGDDDALQFVGALADHEERGIAIEALDRELLRIAIAAMDAHRLEADIDRGLGG